MPLALVAPPATRSEMGSSAAARGALAARDGAISGPFRPGVRQQGATGAIDAHDAHDGLGPGQETGAGVRIASASTRPILEEPLTPQTASSFDSTGSSLQFPLFISGSSGPVHQDPPSRLLLDQHHASHNPDSTLATNAGCLPLFDTFSLSPAAPRSTDASCPCSYRLSGDSHETQITTMPGPIFDAPAEQRFPPSSTTDYFARTCTPSYARLDAAYSRPSSAGSTITERTASPLGFSRWAKRHHHHHHLSNNGEERESTERRATRSSPKRHGLSRSTSIQRRQSHAVVPQMTREEFEALPLAIQRKYFSTLERLRFAQESCLVDGISQHYDDISNFKRQKPRQNRSVSEQISGRIRRGAVSEFHSPISDSSPLCANLSEAASEPGFTRERRRRASVILDAADEAVYKLNQHASRRRLSTEVVVLTPPHSPARNSMDSLESNRKHHGQSEDKPVPHSFFDSFRWLEEEEDLDLRLFLDDYHANLRESASITSRQQRPSFRRNISINKSPFGRRSSVSSTRPGTKDDTSPISIDSSAGSVSNGLTHTRRKSRALSLITPKHAPQPSITAFDPAAAHYQDPEARLKLRVYLASPQKFDEAVEFGFPSADALSSAPTGGADGVGRSSRQSRHKHAESCSNMRTFLADDDDDDDDDNISLNSQSSLADPDSPKTPEPFEPKITPRHARLASADVVSGKEFGRKTPEPGCYAQIPASSREMTLRMTLTRPDLRAHEEEMYGWQQKQAYQHHNRRQTAMASFVTDTKGGYLSAESHKGSVEGFPEVDHWSPATGEKGVMRRIWNRVRRA